MVYRTLKWWFSMAMLVITRWYQERWRFLTSRYVPDIGEVHGPEITAAFFVCYNSKPNCNRWRHKFEEIKHDRRHGNHVEPGGWSHVERNRMEPMFPSDLASTVPSGELTFCHGKSPFLMGKSTINGPFSIAVLVHQRVGSNWKNVGSFKFWRSKYV